MGVLVVGFDEAVHRLSQGPYRFERAASQGPFPEDAEPDFDLVHPGSMRGRVMEMDVGVSGQPSLYLGLVGPEVVEDDVDLPVGPGRDDPIHEGQELPSLAALEVSCPDQPGGHVQGGEQRGGSVALVLMVVAGNRLAVGHLDPALVPVQRLYRRLLVHAQHQRILGRLQIQAHDACGLGGEVRVRTQAPAVAPAQADALLAQDLPDVVDADAQLLRDQGAGPVRVACGRGFVQAGEDAPHGRLGVAGRLAGTRLVGKTGKAFLMKAPSPFAHRGFAGVQRAGDVPADLPAKGGQDDPGAERHAVLGRA